MVEATGVAGEAGSSGATGGEGAASAAAGAAGAAAAGAASASFFVLLDDGLVTVVHSLVLAGMVRGDGCSGPD